MSVLNDEVQDLVKNKYLFRGLPEDIKDWSEDDLLKVYNRLLSVYDPGYDVDNPVSKKGRFRIFSYIRCMGIGYLVSKKEDLSDRSKALKIITTLDNSISGRYRRDIAAQRVRSVAKQEQLNCNKVEKLKKKKQTVSDQENVAPNLQHAVSTQKIWLQDAVQGSVEQNPEKTPPVSQGFQLPRTPFVIDKQEKLQENQTDDNSSFRTCVTPVSSNIIVGTKENFKAHDAVTSCNIPMGRQIPRTPKSVDFVVNEENVDNSPVEILNGDVSSTQEFHETEEFAGYGIKNSDQGFKGVTQKYVVEEYSTANIISPHAVPKQSHAVEITSEQMSAKRCLKNEIGVNLKSNSGHLVSKEEKNVGEKTVGGSTSAVNTSEDNTSNITSVQTLDSEKNAILLSLPQACQPSEDTCDRRKTYVVCKDRAVSDKPMAIQSSENKAFTEAISVSPEQLSVRSMQKQQKVKDAKDLAFTHESSTICEAACNENDITNDEITASEVSLLTGNCLQDPDGTCSSSSHRQILLDALPVSTGNLVSQNNEGDVKVPVIPRQLRQLQDQPLSVTGTPEFVDDSAPLRESRKNFIPRGKQLKRTPTGPSPVDEQETGCVLVNCSVLESNNRTFEVTVIEPDLDYSLQIFVKGEVPERLRQEDDERCIGSSTSSLAESGNKILSTVERTQEIGSRIEKMIMPKQIFKEEQIPLQNSSIKKEDSGMVNKDLETVQECMTAEIKSIKTENCGGKKEDLEDSEDLLKSENTTCSVQNKKENCKKQPGSKLLDIDDLDESLQIFLPRKGKKAKSQTSADKKKQNSGSPDSSTLHLCSGFPKTTNNILMTKDVSETRKREKKMRGCSKNRKKVINNSHATEDDKGGKVIQEDTAGCLQTQKRHEKIGVIANENEKNTFVDQFLSMNPEKREEHQIIKQEASQKNEKQESSTVKPKKGRGKTRIVKNLPNESTKTNLLLVTEDTFEMGCKEANTDSDKGAALVPDRYPKYDAAHFENYLTSVKDPCSVELNLNEEANFTLPSQQEDEAEPIGSRQPVRKNGNGDPVSPASKGRFGVYAKESVSSLKTTKKQNSTKQQKQGNNSVAHAVMNVSKVVRVSSPHGNAGRRSDFSKSEKSVKEIPKQARVAKSRKCNIKVSTRISDKLEVDSTKAVAVNCLNESVVTHRSIRIQKDSNQYDISKGKRCTRTSDRLQENSPQATVSNDSLNNSNVVCLPSSIQEGANQSKLSGKGGNKTQYRAPRSKRSVVSSVTENIDDKNVKTPLKKLNLDLAKSCSKNDKRTDQSGITNLRLEMGKDYTSAKIKKGQRVTGNASQETAGSHRTSKGKSLANKMDASYKRLNLKNVSGEGPSDIKRMRLSVDLSDTDFAHSASEEVSASIADYSKTVDYKEKSGISNKKSQRKAASMNKASYQVSKVNVDSNKEDTNVSNGAIVTSGANNLTGRTSRGRGKKGIENKSETAVITSRKRSYNQNNVEEPLQFKKQPLPADPSNEDLSNSASESYISVPLTETLVLKDSKGILDKKSQTKITNRKKERSLASKMDKTRSTARKQNFQEVSISVSKSNISCEEVKNDTSVSKQNSVRSEATTSNFTNKSSRGRGKRGTDNKLEVIEEVIKSRKKILAKDKDILKTDKNETQNNQNTDDRSTDVLVTVRASRKCKTKASATIADMLKDESTDFYVSYRNRRKAPKAKASLKTSKH